MFDRIAALLIALASSTTLLGVASASHPDWVRFDLPPTTMAVSEEDPEIVTITLRLSSMIASPTMPRATAPRTDQWIVTCRPRTLRESGDGAGISRSNLSVIDYFPRTETASDVSSPIAVKQSEEQTQTTGLSVDATYHPLLQGQLGADHGSKSTSTLEFNRHAPVQAVTAAGTIDRGHGVYFKLRWTATQVLEGEKQFKITLRVPHDWRGSLIDVSVRADRTETRLGGFDQETVTLGSDHFVVAAYRAGDLQAQEQAAQLAEAEHDLRQLTQSVAHSPPVRSLPQMLRHVVAKFDPDSRTIDHRWLHRLLAGRADPHLDKAISKLPMSLRVAALDYADCRDDFAALALTAPTRSTPTHEIHSRTALDQHDTRDETWVAKPMLEDAPVSSLKGT